MKEKLSRSLILITLISNISIKSYAQGWTNYTTNPDQQVNANTDTLIQGDFNGDGLEDILQITPSFDYGVIYFHHHPQISYNYIHWYTPFANGQNIIGSWNLSSDDIFVSGDFNGDGKDELLIANPNGNYHTLGLSNNTWNTISSSTNGQISNNDQYFAGDFDGDGHDEILAIYANGWHRTLEFDTNNIWQVVQGNGSGAIHWWNISSNDVYAVGDFNGDNRDELLATNPNGWHHTMQFNNNNWQYITGGNNGFVGLWYMSSGDEFYAGDFDCNDNNNKDELLAINPNNGWTQTMRLNTIGWPQWQLYPNLNNNGNFKSWLCTRVLFHNLDSQYLRMRSTTLYL